MRNILLPIALLTAGISTTTLFDANNTMPFYGHNTIAGSTTPAKKETVELTIDSKKALFNRWQPAQQDGRLKACHKQPVTFAAQKEKKIAVSSYQLSSTLIFLFVLMFLFSFSLERKRNKKFKAKANAPLLLPCQRTGEHSGILIIVFVLE